MEAMNARNIPFLAGTAVAYGLPMEEALKSVSLNSCEIMGIEKEYGSIEVGKKATLFVSKGNALDMRTNDVTLILIDGEILEVTNSQTDLYKRYKKKLGL
jgi:imidazolonepropionase-like amidohydrolase